MDKYALGNFLAELRNEKGLTQEQLSEMINVNYKTISKLENGNSLPSLDILSQLCEIYDVSLYEMSIYKKINNCFISKENIKKIINKQSITKFIAIKIITLLFLILSIIFITYTCIYTINNYGQISVYELESDNDNFDIKGLFIETNDKIYLSISPFNTIDINHSNNDYKNDKIKNLQYFISINGKLIETQNINLDKTKNINGALSSLNIYISKEKIIPTKNNINLLIKYENESKIKRNLKLEIKLSPKFKNNKLFY